MTITADAPSVLRRLIDEEGYTQQELAYASGRSYQTIHRWLHGKVQVTDRSLAKLLTDLGKTPSDYGVNPRGPLAAVAEIEGRARQASAASDVAMPSWFEVFAEQTATALEHLALRSDDVPKILDRLELMSDQLADIQTKLARATK